MSSDIPTLPQLSPFRRFAGGRRRGTGTIIRTRSADRVLAAARFPRVLQEKSAICADSDLEWARDQVFSHPEFTRLALDYPSMQRVLHPGSMLHRAAERLKDSGQLESQLEDQLDDWFEQRMAPLRRADRQAWSSVIQELRELREQGNLMPKDAPV